MRLIDVDALMDDCMNRYCKNCDKRKGIKDGKWRIIYQIGEAPCRACDVDYMFGDLENAPTVDAVPVGVVEQIRWERDVAMKQLAEHGIPFGGTADDVLPVVRCADCKWWKEPYCVKNYVFIRRADWFCADGERG